MIKILTFLFYALSFSVDQDTTALKRADNTPVQTIQIDKTMLDDFKDDNDYAYRPRDIKKNFVEKFFDWLSQKWDEFIDWIFGEQELGEFMEILIRVLPYMLIALGLFVIIRLLYKYDVFKTAKSKPQQLSIQLSDDEKIVKSNNIDDYLKQAIQEKDFRMAVRYLYLNVLRQLEIKQYIRYTKDKTNNDYINEVEKTPLGNEFKRLTYYYDFIWYGEYPINETFYFKLENEFNDFLIKINPKAA